MNSGIETNALKRMPRLFGSGKENIDFRDVIDSLVRKPGAFVNYKYVNHIYPTTRFRMAYDQLLKNTTEASAVIRYPTHKTRTDRVRWGNLFTKQKVIGILRSRLYTGHVCWRDVVTEDAHSPSISKEQLARGRATRSERTRVPRLRFLRRL